MWKFKIVFLLIIYFSGFATAIYYLAPDGRMDCQAAEYSYTGNSGANGTQSSSGGILKKVCEKTYGKAAAGILGMEEKDFKTAYNRGLDAIKEMVKNNQDTNTKGSVKR